MTDTDLHWVKATHSGGQGGNCVEVAQATSTVHVRNSRHQDGPVLTFTPEEWTAFINGAKDGEFDLN